MSAAAVNPTPSAGDVDLVPMRWWHLGEIATLERQVFDLDPWSAELFWSELAQGDNRHYLVAVAGGSIVGYAGLALQGDESYIQTIGVVPAMRGRHLGSRLMIAQLREARRRGARSCGLEVRTDNRPARALYTRLGFVDLGVRRGYYQPSGGDAYVMRVRPIDTVGYGALLDRVEAAVLRDARAAS
ncbi:ribosomal-protein-alanine acetyltransferase [Parafrankia sp. EAN1pec]|uniref:ribosomal protein S18-alanine N-acetyltransferase n=1 Tax=Parafrankia sp. (strain EAN1pec) TaxID=298653 RepID=UPI0000540FE9|nr:ribosomal-protein-alanine acetyltransferase [Frankia sp. EAN1pec]